MRGLIYKEFKLNRKFYSSFMGMAIMFGLLGFLVVLSSICGNLKNFAADNKDLFGFIVSVLTYMPFAMAVFSVFGVVHSVFSDFKTNWTYYSYTLPTKPMVTVGTRYAAGTITLAVCSIGSMIYSYILAAVAGTELSETLIKNLVAITVIVFVVLAFCLPVAIGLKDIKKLGLVGMIAFILLTVVEGIDMIKMVDEKSKDGTLSTYTAEDEAAGELMEQKIFAVRDILADYWFIIIPVVLIISLLISVKLYQRREK